MPHPDLKDPAERAYRRAVQQTLGKIQQEWLQTPPATVQEALQQITFLESRACEMRRIDPQPAGYLHNLWTGRKS